MLEPTGRICIQWDSADTTLEEYRSGYWRRYRTVETSDMDMISYVFPNASFAKLNKIETPELPRYYFKTIRKAVGQAIIYNDLIFCDLEEVRNADLIAEISD